jgi:hypothetical protein
VALYLIALSGATHVTDVEVSGEEEVGAHGSQFGHRHFRAPHEVFRVVVVRQIDRWCVTIILMTFGGTARRRSVAFLI